VHLFVYLHVKVKIYGEVQFLLLGEFTSFVREGSLHFAGCDAVLNCSARPTTAYKFTVATLRSPSHCAVKSTLGVVLKYTLRPFSRAGL
jgi:hypothetical protein